VTYLIKHLNKEFIFFSFASYISLILFIEKKDESLRFCINYRKLNALIKRNHYSLSLINETLTCIQESKYLTQLNIIVAFNKLYMHSDNEDLTIFITFFNSYKYHVMLFKLINESTFYQHYMNDILFKYLHQFCQIYLDDIIIYSKILKKHKCYDSSYASMLIAMLMAMLMTIVDRSSLDYRVVSRSTLFRVSLCSSESYR